MSTTPDQDSAPERLLTPREVSEVFRVDPRTVARWVSIGRLRAVMTPGGRLRRYRRDDIQAALDAPDAAEST